MSAPTPIQFTVRIKNLLDVPRTVVLEPWTGEYKLPVGTELDIVVSGVPSTPLSIEIVEDKIVVHSFDTAGALLTAQRDGHELSSEHSA